MGSIFQPLSFFRLFFLLNDRAQVPEIPIFSEISRRAIIWGADEKSSRAFTNCTT